jgi:polyphosphate glucokinase
LTLLSLPLTSAPSHALAATRDAIFARGSLAGAGAAVVKDADSGENSPMRSSRKGLTRAAHVLVVDIGGTHVKFRVGAHGTIRKFDSGPRMTPARMMRQLRRLSGDLSYEAVSIGYPGLVFRGKIAGEPYNLGKGWVGYDFTRAFGKPVRVINDAAMQAIGSYTGGRMLFLGLGTGLGATLIIDGVVEPTEVGHMPYKHGLTFEEYVGERGRKRRGNQQWRKAVERVIATLKAAFEADYVVLGGGNAERMKKLPPDVRLGDNRNAFVGGLRLWRQGTQRITLAADAVHRRGSAKR